MKRRISKLYFVIGVAKQKSTNITALLQIMFVVPVLVLPTT